MLSSVFSIVASAEKVEVKPYKVVQKQSIVGDINIDLGNAYTFYPNNGSDEYLGEKSFDIVEGGSASLQTLYYITHTDDSIMIPRDRNATVKFNNVYHSTLLKNRNRYIRIPTEIIALVYYTDNTKEYIEVTEFSQTQYDPTIDLTLTFTPKHDVKRIDFQLYVDFDFPDDSELIVYLGEADGDSGFILELEQQTEEAGLLDGILGWIKNIFTKIGDIASSITELPSKIWDLISNGLQSLFVPSDDYITNFKDDMNILLSERLGAVYDVVDKTLNGWDRIQANDESNTIEFPLVSIDLPENTTFEFGGQEVKVVPDGFEFFVNTLKLVVGIVCTILFINGLKKRYDEIMGG